MTTQTQNPSIIALDDLLEAERAALLAGDLEELTQMMQDKEQLIQSLNTQVVDDLPTLQALGSKVQRNQELLDGALNGIREVANRMAALRRMRGGLDTYTPDGIKHRIEVQTDYTIERRA